MQKRLLCPNHVRSDLGTMTPAKWGLLHLACLLIFFGILGATLTTLTLALLVSTLGLLNNLHQCWTSI
jgi:hypothetical protein